MTKDEKERFEKIEDAILSMSQILTRLDTTINGALGVHERVRELEKEQKSLSKQVWIFSGGIIVIVFIMEILLK